MRKNSFISLFLCLVMVLSLAGCGVEPAEKAAETTEATEPAPTTPADGNPGDATCKGTYYVSDEEITAAVDTVVATVDGAKLTTGQLQIYYWLEVAAHRISEDPNQPDYDQSLDTQPCPIDETVNSWQQYFLKKALSAWHAQQALVLMSQQEGVPSYDPEYKPDLEKRADHMTGMPATEYLYQWAEEFKPNRLHQAYLDTLAEKGPELGDDQIRIIAGAGADDEALLSYATLSNLAYMYFTEMGYYFEPTAEEIQAYYAENMSEDMKDTGKTVDIRHILLIPENGSVAADGTVTAGEDSWNTCLYQARSLADKWRNNVNKTRFSQYAGDIVPEARFSELAKDHSQDAGSAANGGLYVNLQPGQLMPELDTWCFDDARQRGDCEIIRSAAGYHIVFFSGAHENRDIEAEKQLIRSLSEKLVSGAMEKYPVKVDYASIKLGIAPNNGSFVTASDLLYPDVAHERFPDMPLYLQQDYPDAPFGNYKVSTHGCGITTLAMVASYLVDDELTPAELAARYGYYCGERGSEIILFDNTPAEMGFQLHKRSYSWAEMDEALRNGQVVVSLQFYGYWTRGGHYLAMIDLTEDGKYVVRDSNLINYKRILRHAEDSHTRGSISEAGQYYWIYEPKVTSIGTCVRCGGDGEGAPAIMFRSAYTCEKCLTATARRDNFLSGLTG